MAHLLFFKMQALRQVDQLQPWLFRVGKGVGLFSWIFLHAMIPILKFHSLYWTGIAVSVLQRDNPLRQLKKNIWPPWDQKENLGKLEEKLVGFYFPPPFRWSMYTKWVTLMIQYPCRPISRSYIPCISISFFFLTPASDKQATSNAIKTPPMITSQYDCNK